MASCWCSVVFCIIVSNVFGCFDFVLRVVIGRVSNPSNPNPKPHQTNSKIRTSKHQKKHNQPWPNPFKKEKMTAHEKKHRKKPTKHIPNNKSLIISAWSTPDFLGILACSRRTSSPVSLRLLCYAAMGYFIGIAMMKLVCTKKKCSGSKALLQVLKAFFEKVR